MMKDGKSIVLIGMPGVGKSTIGVISVSYTHLDVYKRQIRGSRQYETS